MDKKIKNTNRKKIAFLCRDFGSVNRGVEVHILELSKRLKKSFEVDILSGVNSDSFLKFFRSKYDVVIPTNGRTQALKVTLAKQVKNFKTIIVGHAGIGRDDIWNLFTQPDVFVALTDYQKKWANRWNIRSKIIKIPNGIDLDKFSSTGKKINLGLVKPIFLSVGALEWYKHHDLIIKAVAKTLKGSLIIIGKGSQAEKLRRMGEGLLGNERFKILNVPYSIIPEYYRSTDVFTLFSWDREAFGIVYLEALATNLPVVAPDDPPRKEIIGEGGLLVNHKDPSRLAFALVNAANKNWDNKPRKQAEKFSWEKIANDYVKLINDL